MRSIWRGALRLRMKFRAPATVIRKSAALITITTACLVCKMVSEDPINHAHEAALDGKRADRYHYHFTNEIPYIVARFKGMVDAKHWKR
jgi:hypothetical protein